MELADMSPANSWRAVDLFSFQILLVRSGRKK